MSQDTSPTPVPVTDVHWTQLWGLFWHPYKAYQGLHAKHGPTVRASVGGKPPLYFTIDSALVDHVLIDRWENYIKPPALVEEIFLPTVGNNLVASNGETWVKKREVGVHHLDVTAWAKGYAPLGTCVQEFLDHLRGRAERDPTLDMLPSIEHLVFGAACRLVADKEPAWGEPEFEALGQALSTIMEATQLVGDMRKRAFLYKAFPPAKAWIDGPRFQQLVDCVGVMAQYEPDEERRELFLATYENPSTALTWAVNFLAEQPEARERIRDEARAAFRKHGDSLAAVDALDFTEAALREAVRLRPAIAYLVRVALEDAQVGDLHIAKGSTVTVVPYCIHHDAERWPEPTRYRPERFIEGDGAALRRNFVAFGAGPRACVGTPFAMRILKAALGNLALEFDWTRDPSFTLPEPSGRFPWSEKVPCRVVVEEL